MAKVEVSRELIQKAMQNETVVKHLRVIAERVKARADSLARSEGVEMNTWVKDSVRPGGRPQSQVYGDNTAQEYGDARTQRRRILGRAAEEAS